MTPTVFRIPLTVSDADIDRAGHVNNVAWVRHVQDAAATHWQAVVPRDVWAGFSWVVRRHEIDYLKPGLPGDVLEVRTWVGDRSAASWDRHTEVVRLIDSAVMLRAKSVWVLVDAETGRPRRIDPAWDRFVRELAGGSAGA